MFSDCKRYTLLVKLLLLFIINKLHNASLIEWEEKVNYG